MPCRTRTSIVLDHFRIPPGVNFQSRLTEELGNKSMVLLIESANILDSEWTTYESTWRRPASLGIFALHVPGGVYVAESTLPSGRM